MKRLLGACLALSAFATSASATTSDCLAWTDPAGDVSFVDDQDEPQLTPWYDLVGAGLSASTSGLTATFRPDAIATPLPGMTYEYEASFEDADAVYSLTANLHGAGAADLPIGHAFELFVQYKTTEPGAVPGLRVTRSERYQATGTVDTTAGTITVHAAASLFPTALTTGRTWTVTKVLARTGPMSTSVKTTDSVAAAPGDTLEVGAGC